MCRWFVCHESRHFLVATLYQFLLLDPTSERDYMLVMNSYLGISFTT